MFITSKITISGNIFELSDFQKQIWQGALPQQKKIAHGSREKSKDGERSESSFFRAKAKVRHLIDCNMSQEDSTLRPRFVTFTFKENVTDIKEANAEYTNFVRRFNYALGFKHATLQYVTVIEFQKRGAVHYHSVFFNLPYIQNIYDTMTAVWRNGFVISEKTDTIKNPSSYMCKYMTKSMNDKRLFGKKCYSTSQNLKQPQTIYTQSVIERISSSLPETLPLYEKIFESDHCGKIRYRRYDLAKYPELKSKLLALIT